MKKITTLDELARFINQSEDWDLETDKIIEANGWQVGENEWEIANDGKEQVVFDDNANAVVIEYCADDESCIGDTLVHFHIGWGKNPHAPAHKTYEGVVKGLSDCFGEATIISEDEDGNVLPDEEWQLVDAGGTILTGRNNIEADTGVLDWDGIYNTDIVKRLSECDESEYWAIIDAWDGYWHRDESIVQYARQFVDPMGVSY